MPDHLLPWLLSTHSVLSAAGLLLYALMSHTLRQRRHPAAAVGWVLLLLSAPYVGIPLYLMFGSRKLPRARASAHPPPRRPGEAAASGPGHWLRPLAASMGLPPAARYEALALHVAGDEAARALWQVIDEARASLDVCTFLLGRDQLGDAVAEALARRAEAGVRVRLLVDGIGLLMGGRRNLDALAARGVQVARFVPPFRSPLRGRLNLRNHRKLVIADRARIWCGGRNLATEYFDAALFESPAPGAAEAARRAPAAGAAPRPLARWRDLSFDLRGEAAAQAAALFDADWRFATRDLRAGSLLRASRPEREYAEHAVHAARAWQRSKPLVVSTAAPGAAMPGATAPTRCTQLVPSGPDYAEDTLHALLLTGCFRAQRRIVAVTPYLVPDDSLLSALTLAARRGVEVEIVLPDRSNHRLADLARRRAMRELSAAGVRLLLVPDMVHAKAIVFDDALALCGSANLDARSLFLNYELMLAFDAPDDARRFAQAIAAIAAGARVWQPARPDPGLPRRLAEGLVLWLAFQL